MEKPIASTGLLTCTLNPTTSIRNPRYSKDIIYSIKPTFMQIPVMLGTPSIVPAEWIRLVQPEGSFYYYNRPLRVVTDSDITIFRVYHTIQSGMNRLHDMLSSATNLPHDYEVYISADEDTETAQCSYYLLNHENQTEFWLETISSADLDFPPATSSPHLSYVLQEHYWVHREYFPHSPISDILRVELINILRHARGDHLTSESSTFPYNAEQCNEFIDLLDTDDNAAGTTYMTCIVARLWAIVARNRFDHYYGEPNARITREQRRIERPTRASSSFMKICSTILFKIPEPLKEDFNALPTDNLIYVIHWRKFTDSLMNGWKESSMKCAILLIANTTLLNQGQSLVSKYAGLSSAVLSVGGLFLNGAFMHKYSRAQNYTASEAAVYLHEIEHDTLGYEPVATAYSIPLGIVIWSQILTAAQIMSIAVDLLGLEYATFGLALGVDVAAALHAWVFLTAVSEPSSHTGVFQLHVWKQCRRPMTYACL
ncbi:hypothetical protein C8Q75DRAFT_807648 [Abortiporus biennis]|nr:hypothetical protein C8Q75DRAFT_807648 [Abortiporus biennis]